jgi:hypothetical protein
MKPRQQGGARDTQAVEARGDEAHRHQRI